MWEKKCKLNLDTTLTINAVLGPYKLFDPTQYYQDLSNTTRTTLLQQFNLSNYTKVKEILDQTVELGKHRSKVYVLMYCKKFRLPKLKMNGESWREVDKEKLIKHISKTAILKFSGSIKLLQKTESEIKHSGILEGGDDKYGLCKYFEEIIVPSIISGESEVMRDMRNWDSWRKLLIYISMYISKKQDWI